MTELSRHNLAQRGTDRLRPQILKAETIQQYYSQQLGVPVSLEDTFRVLARHNARPGAVPIFTRAMAVNQQQQACCTPPSTSQMYEDLLRMAARDINHRAPWR